MKARAILAELRAATGQRQTEGLAPELWEPFLAKDPSLPAAIDAAHLNFQRLKTEHGDLLRLPEAELLTHLQRHYLNFYASSALNPYITLAAKGPWLVTTHGAILHDSGGYGMLGMGHGPEPVLQALAQDWVIANIMSASFSQLRFMERLRREVGRTLPAGSPEPYAKFLCLNSGSEAMTVALRLSDIHAKVQTAPGARHAGKQIKFLVQKGAFHGRTDRPAQASDSTRKASRYLASFREEQLVTVVPNDVEGLKDIFRRSVIDQVYFEAMLLEPVMGEGDPGKALTPEFYKVARELCTEHGTYLIIDSIQAGLRATGNLSLVDYPGFAGLPAPDMESYSKAINAGQYPLSVLALRTQVAEQYVTGVYGNTMTTNPRALEVAVAVLDGITPAIRANIQVRGIEFLTKFDLLKAEFPGVVTLVQGTGLLVSIALNPKGYKVVGHNAVEDVMRKSGIGVIHGGQNALRFTPHFNITSSEIDLIIGEIRRALKRGPVYGDL